MIDGTGRTETTNPTGEATFAVEEGKYRVAAIKNETSTQWIVDDYLGTVVVEGDTTIEQEVIHIQLCNVGICIVDTDGVPIEGATGYVDIHLEGIWHYHTNYFRTDTNGEAEIREYCGRWSFDISAEGYEPGSGSRITEDGSVEEFVLERQTNNESDTEGNEGGTSEDGGTNGKTRRILTSLRESEEDNEAGDGDGR